MTNQQIIAKEAITNNIYAEEQTLEFIKKYGEIPLHTFQGWKQRGYLVKKGEKAKVITHLWKFKKQTIISNNDEEIESTNCYLCKAYLFTREQVQKL